GFVHRWLEKLSKRCERLTVICLEKGECGLPEPVQVLSLGKEYRQSRLMYVLRFCQYIRRLSREHDVVLVHMNPIYVVMGFLLWRLWRKKVFLWYNHEYGNMIARVAVKMAQTVFFTSPFSFASRYLNSWRMPAGIDTDMFAPDIAVQRTENALLYVGRIAPVKKVGVLIEALRLLERQGINFFLNIAGAPGKADLAYYQTIKKHAQELEDAGKLRFLGKVPNYQTPRLYQQSQILINLSPPGLFDKTVLEAMACETLVLVSSPAFQDMLPAACMFKEGDLEDLAAKIEGLLGLPEEKKQAYGIQFRQHVVEKQSLDRLINQLEIKFSS
ncbi:MAG: glycosyltransferase family 4 protein, partial [Pseudomonadota bacterium]